jgi:hypothetical protein
VIPVPWNVTARPWHRLLGVLLGLLCLSSEGLNAKDASTAASRPAPASAPPPSGTMQVLHPLRPQQLDLPTVRLPAAREGKPYSHVFKASGGNGRQIWLIKLNHHARLFMEPET